MPQIFLWAEPVDMRKQRNGLVAIIADHGVAILDGSIFVFINRSQTIVRCIYWDLNGFAIWSKYLDKDYFRWPTEMFVKKALFISSEQMKFLLQGIDISKLKVHKRLVYQGV